MPSSLFLVTVLLLATLIAANFGCTDCVCTSFDGTAALKRVFKTFILIEINSKKGDSAPLCIQFISATTPINKTAIALKVDQYSTMIISGGKILNLVLADLYSPSKLCIFKY